MVRFNKTTEETLFLAGRSSALLGCTEADRGEHQTKLEQDSFGATQGRRGHQRHGLCASNRAEPPGLFGLEKSGLNLRISLV